MRIFAGTQFAGEQASNEFLGSSKMAIFDSLVRYVCSERSHAMLVLPQLLLLQPEDSELLEWTAK